MKTMNKNSLLKELLIQEKAEGLTDNIKILRSFLRVIKTIGQWRAFVVSQDGERYGNFDGQVHIYHYCRAELLTIFNSVDRQS